MPSSIPPTFRLKNDSGTLQVWSGVLKGLWDAEELRKAIPFREHRIHGHVDRETWEQKRKEDESPAILKAIAERTEKVVGHELAGWNYANYYKDGSSHTFAHRDFNCNPSEVVTLICFGAERLLAFCDCQTSAKTTHKDNGDKYLVIPLSDGSILQFDGQWNMLHYHKVLKEASADETFVGPRVSIQWYEPREPSKWTQSETHLWEAHGGDKNHVKAIKRRLKKDLECRTPEQVRHYIPSQFHKSETEGSIGEPVAKRQKVDNIE